VFFSCGQVDATEEEINGYLSLMNQLESDYPDVSFVYMTGHANGTGEEGNVHIRNRQIRNYCIQNSKIIYEFYDTETYVPNGSYFGDKRVMEDCSYDSNNDGSRDANWAVAWQEAHEAGTDWYDCGSAHSQPLNANRKAYAAWWLWAVLAGWDPGTGSVDSTDGDGSSGDENGNDNEDGAAEDDGSEGSGDGGGSDNCFLNTLHGVWQKTSD